MLYQFMILSIVNFNYNGDELELLVIKYKLVFMW